MQRTTHRQVEAALDDVTVARPGLVEAGCGTHRTEAAFAELLSCAGGTSARTRLLRGIRRGTRARCARAGSATSMPAARPRHDPFLRDAFVGRGKPT
jgi:hypothetical protein